MKKVTKNYKVGITVGDINGIGMEVIIKTFTDAGIRENITPIIYGSNNLTSYYRKVLEKEEFTFQRIHSADQCVMGKVNVINCWDEDVVIEMGKATLTGGKYAVTSLLRAIDDLAKTKFDVLVTAPFNKAMVMESGFKYAGHTDYLAEMSNVDEALMFMIHENLRIGVVTGHIPLKEVTAKITVDAIIKKVRMMIHSLKNDFLINQPKIAVLGLNPHAGDDGHIGDEDNNIIAAAIASCREMGNFAFGPYPADGFFGSGKFSKFDGVLAMYHDQGLIPFKTLAAGRGVNYTAGLPIVRTSPSHGTAYDICGKNIALENSFREAVFLAVDVCKNRKFSKEISANKLEVRS